jgi:hypothetical protein
VITSLFVTDDTEKQALKVNLKEMEENKDTKPQAEVEIPDIGPLRITGNFILKDLQRDKESVPGEVYLCMCGKSSTKPYCDGSHKNK